MKLLIWLAAFTVAVALYATVIRPWLREREWAKPFFAAVEPFELWVYSKSEAILWARWQQFLGLVLTLVGVLGGFDFTVLIAVTPASWHKWLALTPLVLNVTGTVAELLRRDTSKPLAVVALPEAKPPELAAAVAKVEVANAEAKAVVQVEKEKGAI